MGHIAHFSRHGFLEHCFRSPDDRRRFLIDTMGWWPVGDPAWTFVDVEITLQLRIQDSGLLTLRGITYRLPQSIIPGATPRPEPAAEALTAQAASQGDLFATA